MLYLLSIYKFCMYVFFVFLDFLVNLGMFRVDGFFDEYNQSQSKITLIICGGVYRHLICCVFNERESSLSDLYPILHQPGRDVSETSVSGGLIRDSAIGPPYQERKPRFCRRSRGR